ncbi:MAG: DUF4364 family protein [Clostridia bacterium]
MVRRGFIRSNDEIKFLILYSLTFVKFPIVFDKILDICTWCDDGFDYFQINEAFLQLIESSHIEKTAISGKDHFSITQKGIATSEAFENKLPLSVRQLANISALRVTKEIRRNDCIETKTVKRDENDYVVTMKMEDIFSMDFMVVSQSQAALLETQFKKNAERIYNDMLNSLTKDYE